MKKVIVVFSIILMVLVFAVLITVETIKKDKFDLRKFATTLQGDDRCEQKADLRKIPIRSCSGEGEAYLYEGKNPFGPIEVSFEISRDQLLILMNKDAQVKVSVDGVQAEISVLSFTNGRVGVVRDVDPGSKICVWSDENENAHVVQGFITQDSNRPVYDINTFKFLYGDTSSEEMFLTPGEFSYIFFDKYTETSPGVPDERALNVSIKGGEGTVVEKTYTTPFPSGVQGAVVDDCTILKQGNYILNVDTKDSIYWMSAKCPACGDGEVERGEECDSGNSNGIACEAEYGDECSYCSEDCEYVTIGGSFCGDGVVDSQNEQCDDGDENGESCVPEYGTTCTYCSDECQDVVLDGSSCGDGTLDDGEQCDDGNNIDGDGCSSNCVIPDSCNEVCDDAIGCDGYSCVDGSCRNDACPGEADCVCASCGDGDIDDGEECDDGNSVDNDGCEADCTKPKTCNRTCDPVIGCDGGFECYQENCRNSSCNSEVDCICASCGDGDIDDDEQCDDGNNISGDGCNALCMIEEEEKKEKKKDCDGSIGNYVWNDENGDGVQDASEKGLAKIDMKLTWAGEDDKFGNSDDEVYRDDTDSKGRYEFDELCEGKYRVRVKEEEVEGYVQTYDPDGKEDNKTNVRLESDNDEHTKADFGYMALKVAPASGPGLTIILLISAIFTIMVFAGVFLSRKLKMH